MPLAREANLPGYNILRLTVAYNGVADAAMNTPIDYQGVPAILPGTPVYGLAEFDVAPGKDLTIIVAGITQSISGGIIAKGDPIAFDATSRAIPAIVGSNVFGRALTATTDAGQRFQVLITREGTK